MDHGFIMRVNIILWFHVSMSQNYQGKASNHQFKTLKFAELTPARAGASFGDPNERDAQ